MRFLADQAKLAAARERAEGPETRVERLCLTGSGIDLVLRAGKPASPAPSLPAIQPRGELLEVLGRPLAATTMPEGPHVRRGLLQTIASAQQVGAPCPMPEPLLVEAFDPSEEDRLTSIDLRPAKQPLHGAVALWSAIAAAIAALGILGGNWLLRLMG